MSADPPSSPALRASDADRDRVIELLRAAVADGRLDPAEFDERLDGALAARTIKERYGLVRRDGRWTLPHRLALRTAWWWTPTSWRCGTPSWRSAGTRATTRRRHCASAW
jgi:Domain of unknown function (DUF1707)